MNTKYATCVLQSSKAKSLFKVMYTLQTYRLTNRQTDLKWYAPDYYIPGYKHVIFLSSFEQDLM